MCVLKMSDTFYVRPHVTSLITSSTLITLLRLREKGSVVNALSIAASVFPSDSLRYGRDAPNVSLAITSISINEAAPLLDKNGIRTQIFRSAGKSLSFLGVMYSYGMQHKYTAYQKPVWEIVFYRNISYCSVSKRHFYLSIRISSRYHLAFDAIVYVE